MDKGLAGFVSGGHGARDGKFQTLNNGRPVQHRQQQGAR